MLAIYYHHALRYFLLRPFELAASYLLLPSLYSLRQEPCSPFGAAASAGLHKMSILDAFYNNFGLITSILSLLAAIPFWRWFRNRLPSSKLNSLDALLTDTKKLFYSAAWDGTLDDDTALDDIQDQIWE